MSYGSFATLDEAWGGVGNNPPPAPPPVRIKPVADPLPSDVDYSHAGAPIMDDIVNLYTPADTCVRTAAAPTMNRVPQQQQQKQKEKEKDESRPDKDKDSGDTGGPKRRIRKGDDYSDDDSDSDQQAKQSRLKRKSRRGGLKQDDDSSQVIELAAYVLSGVMLIFLFESFISIGGSLRAGASYY